jgi:hypothetical protein
MKIVVCLVAVVTIVSTVTTGCARHYRVDAVLVPELNAPGPKMPFKKSSRSVPFDQYYAIDPYAYGPGSTDSLYKTATSDLNPDRRRQARNELQAAAMRFSDAATALHLASLRATETDINLLLGAASIGLTGAASVAASETAKALAAAATGTQGARALISEQVYRNALTESVIQLIEADRELTARQIRAKWSLAVADYPVEAALGDSEEYHQKGSFFHGLALLRSAAEEKAKAAKTAALASTDTSSSSLDQDAQTAKAAAAVASAAVDVARQRLATANAQLETLATKSGVTQEQLAAANRDIDEAKKALDDALATETNKSKRALQAQAAAAEYNAARARTAADEQDAAAKKLREKAGQ